MLWLSTVKSSAERMKNEGNTFSCCKEIRTNKSVPFFASWRNISRHLILTKILLSSSSCLAFLENVMCFNSIVIYTNVFPRNHMVIDWNLYEKAQKVTYLSSVSVFRTYWRKDYVIGGVGEGSLDSAPREEDINISEPSISGAYRVLKILRRSLWRI